MFRSTSFQCWFGFAVALSISGLGACDDPHSCDDNIVVWTLVVTAPGGITVDSVTSGDGTEPDDACSLESHPNHADADAGDSDTGVLMYRCSEGIHGRSVATVRSGAQTWTKRVGLALTDDRCHIEYGQQVLMTLDPDSAD